LLADGEVVCERRVAAIMRENRISPRLTKRKKPVTTDGNHKMSPSPNLLEQEFHCLTQSMSRKGACLGNAPMESFFASLKKELVHRQRFRTRAQAKPAIFEYIEVFYNRQRRHPGIGYQTPQQAFSNMTWKTAA